MKPSPPRKWLFCVAWLAPRQAETGTIGGLLAVAEFARIQMAASIEDSLNSGEFSYRITFNHSPMRIDHSASTIARPHFAVIDDLSNSGTIVCESACPPPPADDVSNWEAEIGILEDGLVMADEEEAGEVDDFDEDDFDDEFDDDFEEELEDEYDLADLEEVSDEDLAEEEVELPIGGDFVDEDEEPEPAVAEDPEAPAAEEEKPKKGKGKAKGKKKDDDNLDLDDE